MSDLKKSLTWQEAIQKVLEENGAPLHYSDITERIIQQGLRKETGATPAATVNTMISSTISSGGDIYIRVKPGEYALKSWLQKQPKPEKLSADQQISVDDETGAIKAFGMYWERNQVNWQHAKILGRQEGGDRSVDFSEQVGVYLLHDRERVIYVGRAEDAILKRLCAHTQGRFASRWDRFSWFGIRPVNDKGCLSDAASSWTRHDVIQTMEAVLIECMEPHQNRRRGDKLGGNEFLQQLDPEFVKNEARRVLETLVSKL